MNGNLNKLFCVFFVFSLIVLGAYADDRQVIPRHPTLRTGTYLTGNTSDDGQWVIGGNTGDGGQVVRVLDANGNFLVGGSVKFSGRNGTVSLDNGRIITVRWNNETSFSFGDETWRWVR